MSGAPRLLVAWALALGCASGDEDQSRVSFGSIGPDSGPASSTSGADASSTGEGTSTEDSTSAGSTAGGSVGGTAWSDADTEASTGAPPSSYPPCSGGVCEVGACIEVEDGAVCGASCTDATMCPLSADGDALPRCVSFDGAMSCALDCAGGEACPAGMLCDLTVGLGAFCVWP